MAGCVRRTLAWLSLVARRPPEHQVRRLLDVQSETLSLHRRRVAAGSF